MIGPGFLDEAQNLAQHDPSGMLGLTLDFADQCRRALAIAQATTIPALGQSPTNGLLTGLGGSAAGGDFLKAIIDAEGSVPFVVNRDYSLPAWVGPSSVVIAASYSGNTEETLAAYDEARSKGATIAVVSSGGELTARAQRDGYLVITVPGGQPPRTAMGYMLIPALWIAQNWNLVAQQDYEAAFAALDRVRTAHGPGNPTEGNEAKRLAHRLSGKLGVLYGQSPWTAAVANRWRSQINENAKEMVFTHAFPELCHNEILGWEGASLQGVTEWVTVRLQGGDEAERMLTRIEITQELIGEATTFVTMQAPAGPLLARSLGLAHTGDYLSIYLAALAGRDPGQMQAIDQLKIELSQRP